MRTVFFAEKKKKVQIHMAGRDTFQDESNFVGDRESLIGHDSQELEEQVRAVMINYACLILFITLV